MLKAIIIDDEKNSRDTLSFLLKSACPDTVKIVAMADSVTTGIEAIAAHAPDIVFLDIQMNDETGFDMLTKIPKIDFEVVFTTAFDNYALKAIKFCAIDYLLKPIDIEELQQAVAKVSAQRNMLSFNIRFEHFMKDVKNTRNEPRRIAISMADGMVFVSAPDIVYCSARGPYTIVKLKNDEELMSSKNLKDYEDMLSDSGFLRIHNSYLINMKEVKEYLKKDGHVVMSNQAVLEVSRRKRADFLAACKHTGTT